MKNRRDKKKRVDSRCEDKCKMIKKKGERRKRKEKERENITADAVSP
jgi:hypothetical protein